MRHKSPVRWLALLAAATLTLSAAQLADSARGATAVADQVSADATTSVYTGTAHITLRYFDYCDLSTTQRHYVGERSGSMPVTLVIGAALQDSNGFRDPNPFRFSLATDRQGPEGTFGIQSEFYGTTGSGRDALLVYWSFAHDPQTGAINGTLTDGHRSEAAALNLVFSGGSTNCGVLLDGVFPLADNNNTYGFRTAIRGTINQAAAQIHFEGSSWNGNRDIFVDASLRRE